MASPPSAVDVGCLQGLHYLAGFVHSIGRHVCLHIWGHQPTKAMRLFAMLLCGLQFEVPKQVARRSDMDMNGHINNVTFLAWALECVPQDVYDGYKLFEVSCDGLWWGYLGHSMRHTHVLRVHVNNHEYAQHHAPPMRICHMAGGDGFQG